MENKQDPMVRIPIRSPVLDIFRIDESYDIRKVIVNKQKKYDVSSTNPNDFPKLFHKFQLICNCQTFANVLVLGVGITFLIMFIIFISEFIDYWLYPSQMQAIW